MTTFAPPPDSALAPIETALLALLTAVEALPAGPASAAYRAAVRRRGLEASQAGGSEAMGFPCAGASKPLLGRLWPSEALYGSAAHREPCFSAAFAGP